MQFTKSPLSIADQIAKLSVRGLIIQDVPFAENILSHISYYRLRAYTYPFQNNSRDFRTRLHALFAKYPGVNPALLNFPSNWQNEPLWK